MNLPVLMNQESADDECGTRCGPRAGGGRCPDRLERGDELAIAPRELAQIPTLGGEALIGCGVVVAGFEHCDARFTADSGELLASVCGRARRVNHNSWHRLAESEPRELLSQSFLF